MARDLPISKIAMACLMFILSAALVPHATVRGQVRIHKSLTVEDGLVQSQIMCMYEDQSGFLWLGTLGGLSRWDGVNFENFKIKDGLSSLSIISIEGGSDGALYFGTNGGGVCVLRDGKFTVFDTGDGLVNNRVRTICEDYAGRILLGTHNGISVLSHGAVDSTAEFSRLVGTRISDIVRGPDSCLYIAVFGQGVFVLKSDLKKMVSVDEGLPSNLVRKLHSGHDGRLYMSIQDKGVAIYDHGKLQFINATRPHPVFLDNRGVLYIGTSSGVILVKDGKREKLDERSGLSHNTVWSIHQSRGGEIYFGCWGGLSLYQHDKVITLNQLTGLGYNIVTSVLEGTSGEMYFGTFGNGVSIYRNGKFTILNRKNGLGDDRVWSLNALRDGSILIGTHSAGIELYHRGAVRKFAPFKELSDNRIYTIYEARDGAIYVGTRKGVARYKNNVFEQVATSDEKQQLLCYKIFEGSNKIMYFGTRFGVLRYRPTGILDTLNRLDGLSDNHVWSIHEDQDRNLFFGTNNGGLNIYRNGKFDTINVSDGLSDNTIYGILEDSAGALYLSTHRGINILSPADEGYTVRQLRYEDGLASDETTQGAYLRDSQGYLWFGTIKGVSRFDPRKKERGGQLPIVHITRTRLFERDIEMQNGEMPGFNYDENYFKFDFIGIDLAAPSKVKYEYRLTGVDPDWVRTVNRFVQYTNLDAGDYEFQVRAAGEWGNWSDPSVIVFTINPPFWKTWWFITLSLAVLVGIVAFTSSYRVRQLLAIERLRTKLAADLHDSIGSGLTEISILSDVAAYKASQGVSEKEKSQFELISDRSRTLVDNMSDIVWLINPTRDSFQDLVLRLRDSFEEKLEAQKIVLTTSYQPGLERIRLPMEYRQNLFALSKEALSFYVIEHKPREVRFEAGISGRDIILNLQFLFHEELGSVINASAEEIVETLRIKAGKLGGTVVFELASASELHFRYQGPIANSKLV